MYLVPEASVLVLQPCRCWCLVCRTQFCPSAHACRAPHNGPSNLKAAARASAWAHLVCWHGWLPAARTPQWAWAHCKARRLVAATASHSGSSSSSSSWCCTQCFDHGGANPKHQVRFGFAWRGRDLPGVLEGFLGCKPPMHACALRGRSGIARHCNWSSVSFRFAFKASLPWLCVWRCAQDRADDVGSWATATPGPV